MKIANASLLDVLTRCAHGFVVVLMVVMTIGIGYQVFGRFVLNDTPPWTEQLATNLMIWLALLGGAVVAREDRHIALTIVLDRLGQRQRIWLKSMLDLLIAAFGLLMVWYGGEMALIVRNWTIPTLGISRAFDYLAFPVAGALIASFAATRLVKRLLHGDEQ